MSVIQFLETMGRNPAIGASQYAAAVDALDVDASLKMALSQRDFDRLNDLLGGRSQPMMMSQYYAPPPTMFPSEDLQRRE